MKTSSSAKRRKLIHQFDSNTTIMSKTFYIKYENELSIVDKILLSNFRRKYLYHAIEDILYFSKSQSVKKDTLLALLYSPVLSLQNNLAIDFFNIWIDKIYITKASKSNKFLANSNSKIQSSSYITLKLLYTYKSPKKKPEPLW